MIVVDIWGGFYSSEHVARYVVALEEALQLARNELSCGYLVNLRSDIAWGPERNFDHRLERQRAQ